MVPLLGVDTANIMTHELVRSLHDITIGQSYINCFSGSEGSFKRNLELKMLL
jgi:hypothetical protein